MSSIQYVRMKRSGGKPKGHHDTIGTTVPDLDDSAHSSRRTSGVYDLEITDPWKENMAKTFENIACYLKSMPPHTALSRDSTIAMVLSVYDWISVDRNHQIYLPAAIGQPTTEKMWPHGAVIDTRKGRKPTRRSTSGRELRTDVDEDVVSNVSSSVTSSGPTVAVNPGVQYGMYSVDPRVGRTQGQRAHSVQYTLGPLDSVSEAGDSANPMYERTPVVVQHQSDLVRPLQVRYRDADAMNQAPNPLAYMDHPEARVTQPEHSVDKVGAVQAPEPPLNKPRTDAPGLPLRTPTQQGRRPQTTRRASAVINITKLPNISVDDISVVKPGMAGGRKPRVGTTPYYNGGAFGGNVPVVFADSEGEE
jgi:hypothetical protein